ncbi:MAG TPA: hypothetical protein VFB00_11300 [Terriglobales bacterium]|nr:hypothetical protein [Terriglobales bacterium]
MPDIVNDVQRDFWRPPVTQTATAAPTLAEACRRCGTEFMVGAAFCHICGMGRHRLGAAPAGWMQPLEFLRALEFTRVKSWFGLPIPSLCTLLIGAAFLILALAQGLRSAQDLSDFEAIQLWRIQWLMAACAAFLVGILLKGCKSGD